MKMIVERNEQKMTTVFRGEVSDHDIAKLQLDQFDRAVLDTPKKGMADYLQDLEILFRRYEEQAPTQPEQGGE